MKKSTKKLLTLILLGIIIIPTDRSSSTNSGGPGLRGGRSKKMKFQVTQRLIKDNYNQIISVPYCSLQWLLAAEDAVAYTTRREGWAADVYSFGRTAIVTGYAPFGNIRPSYEVNQRYEALAQGVTAKDWEEKRALLRDLIDMYIDEVTQQ